MIGRYVTAKKTCHLLLQLGRGACCKLDIITSQQLIMIVDFLPDFKVQIAYDEIHFHD